MLIERNPPQEPKPKKGQITCQSCLVLPRRILFEVQSSTTNTFIVVVVVGGLIHFKPDTWTAAALTDSCWAPAYFFQRTFVSLSCRRSTLEVCKHQHVAAHRDCETMTTADHCRLRQKRSINTNAQTKQREEQQWNLSRIKAITVLKYGLES